MKKIRGPRSDGQATDLLHRWAELDGKRVAVEAARTTDLGIVNAAADLEATPIVEEMSKIEEALGPWFVGPGQRLLPKGRKSMELGGCELGTRAIAAKLQHRYASDKLAVEALRGGKQGKQTVRVKYELDKVGTFTLLRAGGARAVKLGELGFSIDAAGEQFFIKRVEQAGTIGSQG